MHFPRDPSTFSGGTWTLEAYIRVSPITVPEKVLGSLGLVIVVIFCGPKTGLPKEPRAALVLMSLKDWLVDGPRRPSG